MTTTTNTPEESLEQTPSKEREVIDASTGSIIALDRSLSKAELRARMVEILDRGITADRLFLDVDPDIHYEWVPRYATEISRYKALGFEVLSASKHLKGRNPLHEDGGDEIAVGDVIAMGCSKARKEVLDEIRQERFLAMHGSPGSKTQREEADYSAQAETLRKAGIEPIIESNTESISGAELANALKRS